MGLWWVSSPIFASSDAQKGTLVLSSPLWWAVITPFSLIEISVMTRNSLENLVRWKRLHFHSKTRFIITYWFSDTYKSVRFLRKIRAKKVFVKKKRFSGPENCHFMRQRSLTNLWPHPLTASPPCPLSNGASPPCPLSKGEGSDMCDKLYPCDARHDCKDLWALGSVIITLCLA